VSDATRRRRVPDRDVIVIGFGNDLRGDDAAGLVAARLVRAHAPPDVRLHEVASDPTEAIDLWDGAARAIVVDAMQSGRPAGTVVRVDLLDAAAAAGCALRSSHSFGVIEVVALARALGRLPDEVVAFGIEGTEFSPGAPLSPDVATAAARVAAAIVQEIAGA
jgi:hydrogenase maturation protease